MHRPSLPGPRAFAAAVAVVAGSFLAPVQSAAAGIIPPPIGVIPPIIGIVQPPAPVSPGVYPLKAMPLAVTIDWYDRSTDEQKFVLYRRTATGAWQDIYEVPTHSVAGVGDNYSYVDTSRSLSGQCYMIAAVNQNGGGDTGEECTVRPDASRFPQSVPSSVVQWAGLSNVNDGTGNLQTTTRLSYTSLTWANQTFGVDLDWSESPALWKIEAQGGPHLMDGQAVALRVWGGGWLEYGNETWGVDLVLSDTPSYEWYVLGGPAGASLNGGPFALWNSAADDYLVYGDETFGVNLNWYKKTLPPPPPSGVKTFVAYNCIDEQRPLEMWVADLTAGTGYVDEGQLGSQWADSGCPETGKPFTFTPTATGHEYLVRSVDYLAPGCSNDPTIADCWRSSTTFVGDTNGQTLSTTIG